jgi:hypothetical protein
VNSAVAFKVEKITLLSSKLLGLPIHLKITGWQTANESNTLLHLVGSWTNWAEEWFESHYGPAYGSTPWTWLSTIGFPINRWETIITLRLSLDVNVDIEFLIDKYIFFGIGGESGT